QMFKPLFISSVSACFELENKDPYYSPDEYTVCLNGAEIDTFDTNVFSLFNLTPGREYTVSVADDSYTFRTKDETGLVRVRTLGCAADGIEDDTYFVQMAIDSCPKGGRVLFEEGRYHVRPIKLRSDITIELKAGAVILGDEREKNYPYVPGRIYDEEGNEQILATWEGEPFDCHQSFVSAYKEKNICIVGEGAIDGNADRSTWWGTPKGRKVARPRLVFLNKCENVTLHGITCQNSGSWNIHPYFSNNLGFYDLKINNPNNAPNTDGLDPESCDNVEIIGCQFSVGDDCMAIKSGKIYMGKTYKTPANHHTIRNDLFCDGHGAIVLGSEIGGGVQNLSVSQCVFKRTDRGLRIKSRRGRGKDSVIDGVLFENIKMEEVRTPFVLNMYYFCDPDGHDEYVWSREKHPVGDDTPYMGTFHFKDIECRDCECMAAYFDGLVDQPVKEIIMENVSFSFKRDAKPDTPAMLENVKTYCRAGLYIDNVDKVTLKNVTFRGVVGDKIIKKHCGKVDIS
ncbi:MAG: glycoside hydrolase family 28 protein, partial [Clostridia bacterium]|nr:glycoside hydrolase family 28 protein [Clostridia bacterium]